MVSKGQSRNVVNSRNGKIVEIASAAEYSVLSQRVKITCKETRSPKGSPRRTVKKCSDNTSNNNSIKNDPPKMVSFDTDASLAVTLHHTEYTKEERANTWYSKADLVRIKRKRLPTLKLLRASKIEKDTKEHCIRGLECYIPARAVRKASNRIIAWGEVFHEQRLQSSKNAKDDEAIALAYQAKSITCQESARQVGILDEVAVADYSVRKPVETSSDAVPWIRKKHNTPSIQRSSSMHVPMISMPFSFLLQ